MFSKVALSFFIVGAAFVGVLSFSGQAHCAGKDVVVGKGSPTTKRVVLTRFYGMPNAAKLRLAAVRAHEAAKAAK